MEFIEAQQNQFPVLAARYHALGDLFSKKLWHQLTIALKEFVNDPDCLKGENTVQLYSQFISQFEKHLNQLDFAQICVQISRQYRDFPTSSAIFLEARYEDKDRIGTEGSLILRLELALLKLCVKPPGIKECREILEDCERIMEESTETMDPLVWSNFYRVRVNYYKVIEDANEYYKSALAYLGYTPLEQIPKEETPALARDLAIAALTSETVYNFGELLKHPVIGVLQGTENQWLYDILMAFNVGDVPKWKTLAQTHERTLATQPAFEGNMDFIKKKIRLMALIELVFKRDPHDRLVPFQDIMMQCHVSEKEVEMVVMRAMSEGLIKGCIDQVKQQVSVSFVMPRTLQLSHVAKLVTKTETWVQKIEQAVSFVQQNAGMFEEVAA